MSLTLVGVNQTASNNRVQLRKTLTLMQVLMMGLAYPLGCSLQD